MLSIGNSAKYRQATIADLDQLVDLCRICFPQNLRWCGIRIVSLEWWKATLESDAFDVKVIETKYGIAAFCILVLDEIKAKRILHVSRLSYLLSAIRHPFIAFRHLVHAGCRRIHRNTQPVNWIQSPSDWGPRIRTWLELIATRPDMRGNGFAAILLNHCATMSRDLGRTAVALRVAGDNLPAKALYEKHGYVRLRSDYQGDIYVRFLASV